ncbi:hypothetical protein M2R47_09430, partial [Moraxella sp. Tifton1]|uniref:hypothetical protein n=1 Tax=Moraxella oculi TaxID=2940516 RepID=UPI002011AC25
FDEGTQIKCCLTIKGGYDWSFKSVKTFWHDVTHSRLLKKKELIWLSSSMRRLLMKERKSSVV